MSPAIGPTPTVAATITTLGRGGQALSPGTYRLDLASAPTVGGSGFRTLLITVPKFWLSLDGWAVHRGDDVAVQFWNVDQVYAQPCQWNGTLFRPGPTVGDLVKALVDRPLRNPTSPIDATLDGHAGKYLEWSVPVDVDFSKCDADGGAHYFESWTGLPNDADRYQQGPGQVDRLWILDIDGSRLVIDAFSMPMASPAEIMELLDVVKSVRFER